jgi:2'-5' RNA ligase
MDPTPQPGAPDARRNERTERPLRLFFAVRPSPQALDEIARLRRALRREIGDTGIRWTDPALIHVTLKFLGDTAEAERLAASAAAGEAAAQAAAFELEIRGVGAFPNVRRPQIIWVGAGEGFPLLASLAELLDSGLARRGFVREARPFAAHLTLARIKAPNGGQAAARALTSRKEGGEEVDRIAVFPVRDFVLMRSELGPSGPRYTVLETYALPASQPTP